MGRNGKMPAAFKQVVAFINENVGREVSSQDILLGKKPGRNSETSYLYTFIKLGYVKTAKEGASVMNRETRFIILKAFPANYTSVQMKIELRKLNGYII